jgi:hypothetical protein
MSDDLRNQIRNNLDLKDPDELLEIWETNNRAEWSDTAFDVLREILQQRMGEVPPQNEPTFEIEEDVPDDQANDLEDWKADLLNREDQPELYKTKDVLNLIENINKIAIGVVVIYVLLWLLNLQFIRVLFQGTMFTSADFMQSLPNMLFTFLYTILIVAIIYFPLKALALILRILMEMEFNSRKPG